MKTGRKFFLNICWLSLLWIRVNSKNNSHRNISELLDNLLKGYDNSVRPDFGGPPTVVEIDIMVRSMGPVSETEMKSLNHFETDFTFTFSCPEESGLTYSMDCYFRQSWTDERLSYSATSKGTLALSISMLEKIWKPDTTIRNGKQSYLHTITTPNKFVRLYPDGRVLYSSRLTIKASCPMDLSNFPMDTQRCLLKMGSFGYTTRDVLYRWNPNRTVIIAPDMKMSQFDLISTPSGNSTDHMKSGERSVLEAYFHLRRHTGYFLLQVYLPAYLLVVVSWVSFFLSRTHTGDRVTLGEYSSLDVSFHLQRHMGNFLIQVYGPCTLLCVLSWVGFFLNRVTAPTKAPHSNTNIIFLTLTSLSNTLLMTFFVILIFLTPKLAMPPGVLNFLCFFPIGITTQFTITLLGLEARADLPKVPYPTALDFFVFLSFAFIFASIIQFAIVHSFTKVGSGEIYFNEDSSSDEDGNGSEAPTESRASDLPSPRMSRSEHHQMSIIEFAPTQFSNNGRWNPPTAGSSRELSHPQQKHYKRQGSSWVLCGKATPGGRTEVEAVNSVSKIDRFARIFFPLSFITINIFYWYSYLYNTTPLV